MNRYVETCACCGEPMTKYDRWDQQQGAHGSMQGSSGTGPGQPLLCRVCRANGAFQQKMMREFPQ